MEDPTKVQGKTKSKGLRPTQNLRPTQSLRPTQYKKMFRMLKQIGSSFFLLPQKDFD